MKYESKSEFKTYTREELLAINPRWVGGVEKVAAEIEARPRPEKPKVEKVSLTSIWHGFLGIV